MSTAKSELKAIREQIDEVDQALLKLINQRARLAQDVARVKALDAGAGEVYRPEREAEVRRLLAAANAGPLSNEAIGRVFVEIVSACRALEKPLRIAYLGPEGTFSEGAVLRHFGHSVGRMPLASIEAVFRDVEAAASHYGVVPVENSTEGVVNHTLDMLVRSSLAICGELELRIHHCLLSGSGGIGEVVRVYSHQQSFAQCRRWLAANLPSVELQPVSSNAEATRRVREEPGSAAVAGRAAAETYGLNVLAANIEDEPNNTTRFLVIGAQAVPPSGVDKTSLLLSTKNQPGALHALLEPFATRRISMTKIESRPSRMGVWEYVFFIDIEGHRQDPNVADALAEIEHRASLFKILGSYPRSTG